MESAQRLCSDIDHLKLCSEIRADFDRMESLRALAVTIVAHLDNTNNLAQEMAPFAVVEQAVMENISRKLEMMEARLQAGQIFLNRIPEIEEMHPHPPLT